jgi:hypothetical protein
MDSNSLTIHFFLFSRRKTIIHLLWEGIFVSFSENACYLFTGWYYWTRKIFHCLNLNLANLIKNE